MSLKGCHHCELTYIPWQLCHSITLVNLQNMFSGLWWGKYLTCNLVFLIFLHDIQGCSAVWQMSLSLPYLFPSILTSWDAEKSVAVVIRTQGDEVVVRHWRAAADDCAEVISCWHPWIRETGNKPINTYCKDKDAEFHHIYCSHFRHSRSTGPGDTMWLASTAVIKATRTLCILHRQSQGNSGFKCCNHKAEDILAL